ncbi:MAG TPA: DNA polymerase III subunit [Methylomirabilota bacterium]|nr:DNA polymerase III subunit [Methylomirabilota bacterium]
MAPEPTDHFAALRHQPQAVELLRHALSTGHVAHAYAFVGPAGSGRKAAAQAFAAALVGRDHRHGGARGAAERVARGAHPDVHLIEPTPPESNPKGALAVRVDSIRELERRAALRPMEATVKVFIVDGADTMTLATPQVFLKTLEEPPAATVIILILARPRALPPTVLSRCQIVRFLPATPEGALALLPEGRSAGRDATLALLDRLEKEGGSAVLAAGEALGRDREAAEMVVETCWLWYRDLLAAHAHPGAPLVFADRAGIARERAAALPLDTIVSGLRACREAWEAMIGNVSPRLSVEVLLSRLAGRAA